MNNDPLADQRPIEERVNELGREIEAQMAALLAEQAVVEAVAPTPDPEPRPLNERLMMALLAIDQLDDKHQLFAVLSNSKFKSSVTKEKPKTTIVHKKRRRRR